MPSEEANGGKAVRRVVLAAAGFYLCFTVAALGIHGGDARWFLWIGDKFSESNPRGRTGYDGQFVYYIALDGLDAAPRLDDPPYRLTRIVLPLASRLLSAGRRELVPWAIVAINLATVTATTWTLARWLAAHGCAPAFALAYPFYVGTFLAFSRALTEPLAFFLAAAGTIGWLRGRRAWPLASLALAALTKEITVVITVGLAAAALARRRFADAAAVLASALPLLLWWGFLHLHFAARYPVPRGALPAPIPLAGVAAQPAFDVGSLSALVGVALPAMLLLPGAFSRLRANAGDARPWLLVIQCAWALLLPAAAYGHVMSAGRNATGVVIALLIAMPLWRGPMPSVAVALWTIPTVLWLPPVLLWSPWGPPLREVLRSLLG
jgi:hypothetical protein